MFRSDLAVLGPAQSANYVVAVHVSYTHQDTAITARPVGPQSTNLGTCPERQRRPTHRVERLFGFKPFPVLWTEPTNTVWFWPPTPPPRSCTIAHRIVYTRERVGFKPPPVRGRGRREREAGNHVLLASPVIQLRKEVTSESYIFPRRCQDDLPI